VKIRLKRLGTKSKPFWRVVVADGRSPRDGRFIEEVGFYDPKKNPAHFQLKAERVQHWLSAGAQPSETVKSLMKRQGIKKNSK
jgi:small subunit ribosomal protein S16